MQPSLGLKYNLKFHHPVLAILPTKNCQLLFCHSYLQWSLGGKSLRSIFAHEPKRPNMTVQLTDHAHCEGYITLKK